MPLKHTLRWNKPKFYIFCELECVCVMRVDADHNSVMPRNIRNTDGEELRENILKYNHLTPPNRLQFTRTGRHSTGLSPCYGKQIFPISDYEARGSRQRLARISELLVIFHFIWMGEEPSFTKKLRNRE